MRLLLTIDLQNYDPEGETFVRPSVRGIRIQNGRVAMVHSLRYDYYKFPGGGIEAGESHEAALCREVSEEAGFRVIPESVRAYGYVHRIQKGDREPVFIQDNFYYFFEAEENLLSQHLDAYEEEAEFTLEWVEPERAITVNRTHHHGKTDQIMLEREALVLEKLLEEGFFFADL